MNRRTSVRVAVAIIGAVACMATLTAQNVPPPLVTAQELLDGLGADGSRWLMAFAQDAVLTGTITDSTGAVLPGVTVTAVNEATGNN